LFIDHCSSIIGSIIDHRSHPSGIRPSFTQFLPSGQSVLFGVAFFPPSLRCVGQAFIVHRSLFIDHCSSIIDRIPPGFTRPSLNFCLRPKRAVRADILPAFAPLTSG
jgi:hypothetical protein